MRLAIIQKEKTVKEIKNNLQNSQAVIFYDFHNNDNESLSVLKKDLKKEGGFWKVYKNTLIKRALIDKKDLELKQPSALIFCQKDEYQLLKVLNKFDEKHHKENKIKGGLYEKNFVPAQTLKEWAKLPTKKELLQTFCYYTQWNLRKLIFLLEEIKKKQNLNTNQ